MQNEHIAYFFKSGFYTTFSGETLETDQGALTLDFGPAGLTAILEAAFDTRSWQFLKTIPALEAPLALAEKQGHQALVFRLVDPPPLEQNADLAAWIDAGILDLNRYVLQRSQAAVEKPQLAS